MGKHSHTTETSLPLGLGDIIHKETISEGNKQYEGFGWSRSEAERNAEYNRNSGNSSSSGDSGGSSGGDSGGGGSCCYVTTACLDALGLPRDSLELRAMKILTKDHILKTFRGKRDYVLYQRKGPRIVQAIESREDSQGIWRAIYGKLKDVTTNILSRNYEEGHQKYKELILGLERQFC